MADLAEPRLLTELAGMAGAVAGTGQVGAGLVNPPEQCFPAALAARAKTLV
ncbi:MAG: hypothetical protein ABI438_07235 [Dermatophilaceae bacterium]